MDCVGHFMKVSVSVFKLNSDVLASYLHKHQSSPLCDKGEFLCFHRHDNYSEYNFDISTNIGYLGTKF